MEAVEVFSPAKINLFLAVLGRLDSGFHELSSLVAQLDFGDRLRIEATDSGQASVRMRCSDPSLPTDRHNLAYAAAEGFLLRSGLDWDLDIYLEKRIPSGAGLGGGSSNASATLRALGELARRAGSVGLSPGEAKELAAKLGSDCPLFLSDLPVVMRGRGERLHALDPLAAQRLSGVEALLFMPPVSIGTAWAYGELARRGCYDRRSWAEGRLQQWLYGEIALGELLHNRFETVALDKLIGLDCLLGDFRELGVPCLLSGSGSCCFALAEDPGKFEELEFRLREALGSDAFLQRARLLA